MSSYKKYITLFSICIAIGGCAVDKSKNPTTIIKPTTKNINIIENNTTYDQENLDILLALEFQNKQDYKNSSYYFEKLYNNTNKPEYLLELLVDLYDINENDKIIDLIKNNITKHPSINDKLNMLLSQTYLKSKKYDEALKIAKKLYIKKQTVNTAELLAKIYYGKKEYRKAYKYTLEAFNINPSTNRALSVTEILYKKLNKTNDAIIFLEEYANKYDCDMPICSNLLFMYNAKKDTDGTIKMLQKIYYNFKEQNNIAGQKQAANMLVQYLEQKNEKLAMIFLEKEHTDDNKLLFLYKKNNQISQAIRLMNEIYLKTADINIIAQMAILEFESAKDKEKVLPSVISKFKDALAVIDNASYQNYLGYILIDYDVDIKEGLKLVKLALQKDKNNIAYIDSLAWAQYKLNMCTKAYKNMKKVVDEVGLKDEEIILHWNKIRGCNNR